MIVERLADAAAVAQRGADVIAEGLRVGTAPFHLAVSGGTTPRTMFSRLAALDVPWERLHLWQVDERLAPHGDPSRNLTMLAETGLLDRVGVAHAMPVAPLAEYDVPTFDLVHLGMGADGHTASLVPGDPVLDASGDVALTGEYQGRRRMTLTFSALRRARSVLWVVTGADKAPALRRLLAEDTTLVAARVAHPQARLLTDVRL